MFGTDVEQFHGGVVAVLGLGLEQDVGVGGNGQPAVVGQFLFELARCPDGVTDEQLGLFDLGVVVPMFEDVGGGGKCELLVDAQAVVPVTWWAVQHEAAIDANGATNENVGIAQVVGNAAPCMSPALVYGNGGGFVDDETHAALFGTVVVHIDHAACKEGVWHIGHGDEVVVGQVHGWAWGVGVVRIIMDWWGFVVIVGQNGGGLWRFVVWWLPEGGLGRRFCNCAGEGVPWLGAIRGRCCCFDWKIMCVWPIKIEIMLCCLLFGVLFVCGAGCCFV